MLEPTTPTADHISSKIEPQAQQLSPHERELAADKKEQTADADWAAQETNRAEADDKDQTKETHKKTRSERELKYKDYITPHDWDDVMDEVTLEEARMVAPFDKKALESLYSRFVGIYKAARPTDNQPKEDLVGDRRAERVISGKQFMRQHEFINHPFKSRISAALKIRPIQDITFFQYLRKMNTFNVMSSKDAKMEFLFCMFDVGTNGLLTPEHVRFGIDTLVGGELTTQELDDIVGHIFSLVDIDESGNISKDEFIKIVGRTDVSSSVAINNY